MFKMVSIGELREQIKNRIGDEDLRESPELESEILRALEQIQQGHKPADLDAQVIERARKRRESVRSLHKQDNPTGAREPTTADLLTSEALVNAIAPQVGKLRNSRFESLGPPFTSIAEASAWVEEESASDLRDWRGDAAAREEAHEEIERLAREHRIEIVGKQTLLTYQRPGDDHVKHVPAIPETYLHKLAKEAKRITKHTGLPEDAVVMHVLTGLTPIRSRARITTTESYYASVPGGEQIDVSYANVVFYARDLTYEELRSIYNGIRGHVTGKGRKGRADDPQARIWTLVQERGGPPREHGTKQRFWREILEAWQSEQPSPQSGERLRYTTARGVEKAYDSARKRLE